MSSEGSDFRWSEDKNEKLRAERNLSFEEVVAAIDNGRLIADSEHQQTS